MHKLKSTLALVLYTMVLVLPLAATQMARAATPTPIMCPSWADAGCVSGSNVWESTFAAAFVMFTDRGYDDNAAAGMAEARADAALKIFKARHAK